MTTQEPIVVVIVDDHSLFSRGLELLLTAASEGRITVAGRTESAGEALAAGAHGFIPKSSDPDVLVPPLLSLGGGLSVLPTSLLQALVELRATRHPALLAKLGDDDIGLWRLVARGLEVGNRVEAALLAGRVGLLDGEGRTVVDSGDSPASPEAR